MLKENVWVRRSVYADGRKLLIKLSDVVGGFNRPNGILPEDFAREIAVVKDTFDKWVLTATDSFVPEKE